MIARLSLSAEVLCAHNRTNNVQMTHDWWMIVHRIVRHADIGLVNSNSDSLIVESDGTDTDDDMPHVGHYSRLGGTYWCDTCNSPYCDLA